MNIIGEKVILRAIEPTDRDMFLNMINDPEIEEMVVGHSFPVSKLEQEKWIEGLAHEKNILRCVIAKKETPQEGIGTVIISDIDYKNGVAQIHIKLLTGEDVRHQGFGKDAVNTISKYAFDELRINVLYAEVLEYNEISQKLFLGCGFKKDGVLRQRAFKHGRFVDIVSLSLLRTD